MKLGGGAQTYSCSTPPSLRRSGMVSQFKSAVAEQNSLHLLPIFETLLHQRRRRSALNDYDPMTSHRLMRLRSLKIAVLRGIYGLSCGTILIRLRVQYEELLACLYGVLHELGILMASTNNRIIEHKVMMVIPTKNRHTNAMSKGNFPRSSLLLLGCQ